MPDDVVYAYICRITMNLVNYISELDLRETPKMTCF